MIVVGKVSILLLKGMKLKGGDERDAMENIKTKTYSYGFGFWKEIKFVVLDFGKKQKTVFKISE